ncbi:MAG: hypothetical protein PHP64_05115 [Actinomycetota bacterium]|nr:hypothetical protein [Actinomycetota bacterium]
MKATIVIPSYWGRPTGEAFNPGDIVYDHPTPLDEDGTLSRALESISTIEDKNFDVVVLACATSPDIAGQVEEKVERIVSEFKRKGYGIACLSHSFEKSIKQKLTESGNEDFENVISLCGYSNIRNMCLIVAELAGSDIAVLFDDDEVYEDPNYLQKVRNDMSLDFEEKPIRALAGYYRQKDGGYLLSPPDDWWWAEYPMVRTMNEAFRIIGEKPRFKKTPFVFGGNMCIHRGVFRNVSFDPNVRRGEDIDYLFNCKCFGIDFILDNELAATHLPPEKKALPWQHLRENIYRFIFARAKLRAQDEAYGGRIVPLEELEPYPESCMRDDFEEIVFKTAVLMGMHYLQIGDELGFTESMRNIYLARYDAPPKLNPFASYMGFNKQWVRLMDFFQKDRTLADIVVSKIEG